MSREYDVVVVGARVAGSTLAALLGDLGVRVLLVERVRFPRSTISTHFFRGAGLVAVLDRLGLLEEVLALGCPRITREWDFGFGSPGPEEGPPQRAGDVGFGLSVRRAPLDELLLERARRCSTVEVAQPATVRALLRQDDRVSGVTLAQGGREVDVPCRIVVGADGRHSTVAREVAPVMERSVEPLRTLYYRYVAEWRGPNGEPPDAAEFSLNGDEMAYVFPSDGGVTCIGLSAPAAAFAGFRAAPDAELARRLEAHPGLMGRISAAVAVGRTEGGPPEASWVSAPAGPGWALVGDAGWHQDPWTGEGMDNAGVCAASAADAIAGWLAGATSEHEAMARYGSLRRELVDASFDQCTSIARDLSQLAPGSAGPEGAAVLVTGMSATGKSTVLGELGRRGHRVVDTDRGGWIDTSGGEPLWREDRMAALLAEPRPVPLFVGGCVANQGRFAACFDAVVLLSAPQETILERLATRTTNDFGKRTDERARILADLREIEPLLRRTATAEIDTRLLLAEVVRRLEDIAGVPTM